MRVFMAIYHDLGSFLTKLPNSFSRHDLRERNGKKNWRTSHISTEPGRCSLAAQVRPQVGKIFPFLWYLGRERHTFEQIEVRILALCK
jgi:hypothetical protein